MRFPVILSFTDSRDVVLEYTTVFDKCNQVIYNIIKDDIWPRFKKHPMYLEPRKGKVTSQVAGGINSNLMLRRVYLGSTRKVAVVSANNSQVVNDDE